MRAKMKNFLKILLLNIGIIIAAILTYSNGFLGLRPTDDSILRAGFSILIGLGLAGGLLGGNYALLKEPKKVLHAQLLDKNQVENVLKEYFRSKYFAEMSKTTCDQIGRIEKSTDRALLAVNSKFSQGSMSNNRYQEILNAASQTAFENMKNIASRIQMFDDDEYSRLSNYKNDNIPDDIQEKQIELYNNNIEYIKNSIAMNENLILKLDTLALEISNLTETNEKQTENLLKEITVLTQELKYYN